MENKNRRQATSFMITQQVNDEYWEDIKIEGIKLSEFIERLNILLAPKYILGILHNKDRKPNGEPKEDHVHIWVKLDTRKDMDSVARIVGVKPEFIETRKGRYAEENALAYLIHANDGEKHQYSPMEVETIGFDYITYYNEHKIKWNKSKATTKRKKIQLDLDYIKQEILSGRLFRSEMLADDDLAVLLAENEQAFNSYFRIYAERRAQETIERMNRGEIRMQSFYITGSPGAGKTRLANKLAKAVQEEALNNGSNWRIYRGGALNPFDEYSGEEIVILDDLRISSMSASDWLKILDPYNNATMSARYKNKQQSSRVIIMTSYLEPVEFFYYAKGNGGNVEAVGQFLRRIEAVLQVFNMDEIYVMPMEKRDRPLKVDISTREGERIIVPLVYDYKQNGKAQSANEIVKELPEEIFKKSGEKDSRGEQSGKI